MLAVCAAYRPPLGDLGVGPDRAIMHQAAEVMIQSFTIHIQMAIVHSAASPEAGHSGILWRPGPEPGTS
jgi:hypothetical protein